MSVIGFTLLGVALFIMWRLRLVWTNYKIIGQLLDILAVPGVQDRLFARQANLEMLQRTASQYVFLTKYVPVLIVGVFTVMGSMYAMFATGMGLSSVVSFFGALTIAGVVSWLINFEAVPLWLYDWHLTVLLTRSNIDLEAITETLNQFEQRVNSGEFDDLTEVEQEYVILQVSMMETVARDVTRLIEDLEQQRETLHAHINAQ